MGDMILLTSTGVEQVDQIIRGVISLLEFHFPARIRGYYLEGSYADGSAVPTSDIDLSVIFKATLSDEEEQQFNRIRAACKLICPCALDLVPISEVTLLQVDALQFPGDSLLVFGSVGFKYASVLIYGEDIRSHVPDVPMDTYTRHLMHFAAHVLVLRRGNPPEVFVPIDYPDPTDEFYGYARRQMRTLDGTIVIGTKNLVLSTMWIATALIALRARQYVASKLQAVAHYQRWINDAWTLLLEAICTECRMQWHYQVPVIAIDRQRLRDLCAQALAFENHFLAVYKTYVFRELQHANDAIKLHAVQRLGQIRYVDATIPDRLQAIQPTDNMELCRAIETTIYHYATLEAD